MNINARAFVALQNALFPERALVSHSSEKREVAVPKRHTVLGFFVSSGKIKWLVSFGRVMQL